MKPSGVVRREARALNGGAVLMVLSGRTAGPTLALLAGVHGDEDEGVLAVQRVLGLLDDVDFRGTVKAVAPAHPVAWAAHSRISPLDGANLARCFPGAHGADATSELAADLTEQVINDADLLIDLHSAGLFYRMPVFCGFVRGNSAAEASRRAAEAFGSPLIWAHPDTAPGRSLSVAEELGVAAFYAECSGGGAIRRHELDAYVDGVLSVMSDLEMLSDRPTSINRGTPQWVYGSGDLDQGAAASHDGLFVSSADAGELLQGNDEVGRLYDYRGRLLDVVRAPRQGVVMFLRSQARTRAGDVLFIQADVKDPQE